MALVTESIRAKYVLFYGRIANEVSKARQLFQHHPGKTICRLHSKSLYERSSPETEGSLVFSGYTGSLSTKMAHSIPYLSNLLSLSALFFVACASPGPDFINVVSHALGNRG